MTQFALRIPDSLHTQIKKLAEDHHRSFSEEARMLIQSALDAERVPRAIEQVLARSLPIAIAALTEKANAALAAELRKDMLAIIPMVIAKSTNMPAAEVAPLVRAWLAEIEKVERGNY